MNPKRALEQIRTAATVEFHFDVEEAVRVLEEYFQLQEEVIEHARSYVCLRSDCKWALCCAIRDLDQRFPDEVTSPSGHKKRNRPQDPRSKTPTSA